MIRLRKYQPEDCGQICRLFYDTVHVVCREYTPEERRAWAPEVPDAELWHGALQAHNTWVAEVADRIAGFCEMTVEGYLDKLYVHKDYQRCGIATALCDKVEEGFRIVTSDVSLTARPFFEQRGYQVVRRQRVERFGVLLTNFKMERRR